MKLKNIFLTIVISIFMISMMTTPITSNAKSYYHSSSSSHSHSSLAYSRMSHSGYSAGDPNDPVEILVPIVMVSLAILIVILCAEHVLRKILQKFGVKKKSIDKYDPFMWLINGIVTVLQTMGLKSYAPKVFDLEICKTCEDRNVKYTNCFPCDNRWIPCRMCDALGTPKCRTCDKNTFLEELQDVEEFKQAKKLE